MNFSLVAESNPSAALQWSLSASHCRVFSLCRARALGHTRRLSTCGSGAREGGSIVGTQGLLAPRMWDLPGSETEPMSPM